MIYDVFNGKLTFHVKRMLDFFIEYSQVNHYFVIYATDDSCRDEYVKFFADRGQTNYHIISQKKQKLPLFFRLLTIFKKEQLSLEDIDLLCFLSKHRNDSILFHGCFFSNLVAFAIALGYFRHISWGCWGTSAENCFPEKIKDKILQKINLFAYRKMDVILTLMQGDFEDLKKYHRRNNYLVSYVVDFAKEISHAMHGCAVKNYQDGTPVKVLIGNSGHCRRSYLSISKQLEPYRHKLDLCFMYNYTASNDRAQQLTSYLDAHHFHYTIWDKVVSIDEYIRMFSVFDVYLCGEDKQTGLGAIAYAQALGKSIYLCGYNYDWIKGRGYYVETVEQFVQHLQNAETWMFPASKLLENKELFYRLTSMEANARRWDDVLHMMEVMNDRGE